MIFSSSSDLAVDSKHAASSGEASGDEQTDEKMDEAGFSGRQVVSHFFDLLLLRRLAIKGIHLESHVQLSRRLFIPMSNYGFL